MGIIKFKNGRIKLSGNDANEFVKYLRGDDKVALFNKTYNVGDMVRVIGDDGKEFIDEVKYPASIMGGHTAMAWLKEKGSYRIERVIGLVNKKTL